MRVLGAIIAMVILMAASPLAAKDTWIVRTDLWGSPAFSTLTIDRQSGQITGDFDGDRVSGKVAGKQISFTSTDAQNRVSIFSGIIDGAAMTGTADTPDTNAPTARAKHGFKAWQVPVRPSGGPKRYDYVPVDYSNTWNADRKPVLVIWPGDSVNTTVIDSGGVDERGVTRALFGNPQTGPFFVAGASPGDTLVVRIKRLKLNRDYADSLDTIVSRALGASLIPDAANLNRSVRWNLDIAKGSARPEGANGALSGFSVPVRPMLGGLAVAPGFGSPPISTGDTGRYGGNMDFPDVIEGNTVYLPVQQPGALLYLGDAHALQGDGETSQYGLETSMAVEFAVDIIKDKAINMPRVESPTQIIALGQAGSLDEAVKVASTGIIEWLQADYGLTLSQAAQVLGSSIRYNIPNLAGRSVGVAARLEKSVLPAALQVVTKNEAVR